MNPLRRVPPLGIDARRVRPGRRTTLRLATGLAVCTILLCVRIGHATAQEADGQAARTGGTLALSPKESRAAMHVRDDLLVELMASEPLVFDPIAIDWGYDGRLWVCEMADYPRGVDGNFQPGGRIAVLDDSDEDGIYDRRTVFADELAFPTDVAVWKNGAIVCAAPDILYLRDETGDGRADGAEKLFTGFATHNYQARPNSLRYGLDNWWYGANGLFSETVECVVNGTTVDIRGRDFRLKPSRGSLEAVSGLTQHGRTRDDWGNWFGCDNSRLLWHYPLSYRYLGRNPHLTPPNARVVVPRENQLFPRGSLVTFKLSGAPGLPTAACGVDIYRDDLLGKEFYGNAFTCEPVNQLVHREVLTPRQSTFTSERARDESDQEFLASTDQWFRPVQVRTGPDGCIWIVDMYRFLIEHPRWIPEETLAMIEERAGESRGRIYRVKPRNQPPRPIAEFDAMTAAEIVRALDTANGFQRDRAQQLIVDRAPTDAVPALRDLARRATRPATRLAALCTLDGLGAIEDSLILDALTDDHPGVRRRALRLSETRLTTSEDLASAALACQDDPDAQVRMQLAYTLGEWNDDRAAAALAKLASQSRKDPYLLAAAWSSLTDANVLEVLCALTDAANPRPPTEVIRQIVPYAVKLAGADSDDSILDALGVGRQESFESWQLAGVASLLETHGSERHDAGDPIAGLDGRRLEPVARFAADLARDESCDDQQRLAAAQIVVYQPPLHTNVADLLKQLLGPRNSPNLRGDVVRLVVRARHPATSEILLKNWINYPPTLRATVIDEILSRHSTTMEFLRCIDNGKIDRRDINATQRQQLLAHVDDAIRTAATEAFSGEIRADRQSIVDQYAGALKLPGDENRGKAVFVKYCASCHRLEDVGVEVGPDLAALTANAPKLLLESILDPNRRVDERYQTWIAVSESGLIRTGMLVGETTDSVTLRQQQNKDHVLRRSELEELENTRQSLMPEGFEKDLSQQDAADLLEFIMRRLEQSNDREGKKTTVVSASVDEPTARIQSSPSVNSNASPSESP